MVGCLQKWSSYLPFTIFTYFATEMCSSHRVKGTFPLPPFWILSHFDQYNVWRCVHHFPAQAFRTLRASDYSLESLPLLWERVCIRGQWRTVRCSSKSRQADLEASWKWILHSDTISCSSYCWKLKSMTTHSFSWWDCRGKGTLIYCWGESKLLSPF